MSKGKSLLFAVLFPVVYLMVQSTVSGIFGVVLGAIEGVRTAVSGGDVQDMSTNLAWQIAQMSSIITGVAGLVAMLVAVLWLKAERLKISEEFGLKQVDGVAVLLCLLLGLAANFLISGLMMLVPLPEDLVNQYNDLVGQSLVTGNPIVTVIVIGVLVPVVEEVVFRGMTMGTLRKGFGAGWAVVGSSLIFAIAHIIPLQIAFVLPVAFIIGFAYLWSRSLYGAIAVHIGFNIVSAISSAFVGEESLEGTASSSAPALQVALMVIVGGGICAACLVGLWMRSRAAKARELNAET